VFLITELISILWHVHLYLFMSKNVSCILNGSYTYYCSELLLLLLLLLLLQNNNMQIHYTDQSWTFSGALIPKFHCFMNSGNSQVESCLYFFLDWYNSLKSVNAALQVWVSNLDKL
jgi:hypothetical protein